MHPRDTPPPHRKAETIVGRAPWEDARSPPVAPPPPGRGRPPATQPAEEPTAWQLIAAQLAAILRASPAWTTSLALHVAILLALALWIVRLPSPPRVTLELGFGTAEGPPGEPGNDEPIVEMPGEEVAPAEEPPSEAATAPADSAPEEEPERAVVTETPAETPAAPGIRVALSGRDPGRRAGFMGAEGGDASTEAAVALALDWIVRQQRKDGVWSLTGPYQDGGSQENRLAATAMALLALQGAGSTDAAGDHRESVKRGWKRLLAAQQADGAFDLGPIPPQHALYSHAQATIALCELYGMSRDESLREPATRALSYALSAQGRNGGWRYEPGADGDMSVTGWFVMALMSARMAGLEVPEPTLEAVGGFLDLVATREGRRYGYRRENPAREASPVTAAVSAEGLLCRQYLGWPQDDPRIAAGLASIMEEKPLDFGADKDVYAWYYVTQVAHHARGPAWRAWNARLRTELPARQVVQGREKGSWDPSLDRWGSIGGRLFVTCFCTWMLEVYYRHLPLYGEVPPAVSE